MQAKLLLLPSPLCMSFKSDWAGLPAFSSEQERKEKKRNSEPEIWRFWSQSSQSPVRVNRELEWSEEEGFLVLLLYICFCRWEHGRRLLSMYYCAVRFVLRQWIDSVVVVAVVAAERPTRKKERKKEKKRPSSRVALLRRQRYDTKETL